MSKARQRERARRRLQRQQQQQQQQQQQCVSPSGPIFYHGGAPMLRDFILPASETGALEAKQYEQWAGHARGAVAAWHGRRGPAQSDRLSVRLALHNGDALSNSAP
jgi:hypothetical protein